MLTDLPFTTAVIARVGTTTAIARPNLPEGTGPFLCRISSKTAFVGATENKVAMASLKPGMSVNLWFDQERLAQFASINFR